MINSWMIHGLGYDPDPCVTTRSVCDRDGGTLRVEPLFVVFVLCFVYL